ncbi:acylphosphatase [Actinomycetospora sp. NBRC 106378]|uniref:acylphosphatase n=1 Tax=Actinomycetospora sp. NBRC 106378 TaxID=3032208 RepID=UPI0024A03E4E|nr:acylphosphatase [Actinomycetospora sp. NBRC 106378]GLZ53927.1 acylphosphatase [Actinomycetospora sp. NBRC 106378]
MSARHLVVHGTVQGVFFRASTEQEARRLGVAGWVRNRSDGTVEMVAEGADEAVDALVRWAHEGPSRAEVTGVDVTDREPEGLVGFEQR